MKKKLLFALLLSSGGAFAQQVNYEVIKDEPIEPRISINLDLFNIDINTKISKLQIDNISMNIGTFGHVMPLSFVGVDFNIHKAWLTMGKIGFKDYPGNLEMNVGGFFFFTDRMTTKLKTRIVLKSERGTYNGKEVTTTTFIEVPAKIQKRFGVRAGLYQKSGPFNFRDYSKTDDLFAPAPAFEYLKYNSVGFYGGLMWRRISNIIIKDPKYGQSGTSGATDIYVEAMVIPVNKFTALEASYAGDKNVTAIVKATDKDSPIGFRIGFKKYQVEKKAVTGRKFGRAGIAEFGYRPYIGWFANAGVAITLVKSAKPLSFGGKEKTTEATPQ